MAKSRKALGSVEAVEAAFYDAIAHADIEALMVLWAEDDEIVCIHPGAPRLVGYAAIRASWEAIFERGGVHIHPAHLHSIHNLTTVIHNLIEEIKRASDDQQDLHVLATNVYLKTPHGWRIVVHHACVAPGTVPSEQLAASMLH